MTLTAKDDLNLRPAIISDARLFFDWANEAEVRQNAINQEPIVWENHLRWFTKKLDADETIILILEQEGAPLGQIRFDNDESDRWIIDYSINKGQRGKGYGKILLALSIAYLKERQVKGEVIGMVKESNMASAVAFRKSSFKESMSGNMLQFVYSL